MGLKVWLPFTDGTLKNQGYANITATGTNISSNNNGKLGKCCSFRDSTNFSYIMLSEAPFDNNTTEWSYACWFNPQDPGSNYHCLFSNRTVTSETGFAIFVGTASTYTGSILFDTGKRWSVAVSVPLNTWIHLALTYKRGVEKKLYVNGVLAGSTDDFSTIQTTANVTNAVIGGSQSASTTVNANYMKGQLNDVRIYDHCLSAAEVKELAKGLVLHYKLDDVVNANIITNPNIVGSYVQDGITLTQEAGQLKCVTSSSSSNQRFYQGVSNVWTPLNSTFTVSFDAKGETDGISIDLNRSNYTGQDRALFTLSRDWKHYAGTIINSQNTAGGTLSIRCNTLGATFWIKNIKLERGAVETAYTDKGYITDSSGYGRHGTITGSPIAVGDTPRYLACVNFTSGQMVNTTVPLIGANPIFTVSFWIKMYSNTYTAWANVVWFSGTSYHIRMEVNNNTGKNLGWWNYPLGTTSGIGSGSVNYDEWNMMTMVWNGTNIITYKNGIEHLIIAGFIPSFNSIVTSSSSMALRGSIT